MAILRAGSFANSTDSFLDEPAQAPLNPDGATLPVNCANYSGSSDWSWKYLKISTVGSASEFFDAAKDQTTISENFINDGGFFEGEGLSFSYQASEDFTFSGSYEVNAGLGQQGSFATFEILNGAYQSLFSDTDVHTVVGGFSITLPAATVPYFVFLNLSAEGDGVDARVDVDLIAST
jgi:hypothetical protein